MDNSQGLVRGYIDKVRHLSAKSQMGESIESLKPSMKEVIDEAHRHIAVWINGTPEDNWAHFIGQLGFIGDLSGDSNYRSAMHQARDIAKKLDPPRKA